MSITIPLFFLILAVFFFLFALYEDKEEKNTDEQQEKSDQIVLIITVLATLFFFVGGVCMMGITNTYYSPATDTVVETAPLATYRPLGWIGIAFGFFAGGLAAIKMFQIVDDYTGIGG